MKLKIEKAEVFGVEVPLVGEYKNAYKRKSIQRSAVVRVTATGGAVHHAMAATEMACVDFPHAYRGGLMTDTVRFNAMAEIMCAVTSNNVIEGLECVGSLKTSDDIVTQKIDMSSGSLAMPDGPGLGVTLDEAVLAKYRFKIVSA